MESGGRHIAIKLVYGADVWRNGSCQANPVELEGVSGPSLAEQRPKNDPSEATRLKPRGLCKTLANSELGAASLTSGALGASQVACWEHPAAPSPKLGAGTAFRG